MMYTQCDAFPNRTSQIYNHTQFVWVVQLTHGNMHINFKRIRNDLQHHWINTNPNTTNWQISDFFGFQNEYRWSHEEKEKK